MSVFVIIFLLLFSSYSISMQTGSTDMHQLTIIISPQDVIVVKTKWQIKHPNMHTTLNSVFYVNLWKICTFEFLKIPFLKNLIVCVQLITHLLIIKKTYKQIVFLCLDDFIWFFENSMSCVFFKRPEIQAIAYFTEFTMNIFFLTKEYNTGI